MPSAFLHSAALPVLSTHFLSLLVFGGRLCEVSRRAEECTIVSDHLRPPDPAGFSVALRFRFRPRCTCARP
ncbi:hypothetical protein EDB89DRAFT_2014707 [Lactarius sanguifluus]|nr:hypothetical protein EDB89DRAFT_2014707 [Lactarius sanguifluus]